MLKLDDTKTESLHFKHSKNMQQKEAPKHSQDVAHEHILGNHTAFYLTRPHRGDLDKQFAWKKNKHDDKHKQDCEYLTVGKRTLFIF